MIEGLHSSIKQSKLTTCTYYSQRIKVESHGRLFVVSDCFTPFESGELVSYLHRVAQYWLGYSATGLPAAIINHVIVKTVEKCR